MQLFLDSSNLEEIKKANDLISVTGITTNPTSISKEIERLNNKKRFEEIIQEIIKIIDGPISVEVISTDTDGMIKEAIEISKWSKNIVVKVPMTPDGLRAVKILNTKDINTNVTLVFSVNQALLAAKAGATYVSIFVGRLDDIGDSGIQIVSDVIKIFNLYNFQTKIIAASIRHPLHLIELAKAGVHIATIPFNVLEKMFRHPLTDIGIERFLKDWKSVKNEF